MERIARKRLLPAATVERAADALPLAEALLQGGLDIVEITFRTAAAAEAIAAVAQRFPQMLIGAGTVLDAEQLRRAAGAGARFMVAPGLNEALVKQAAALGLTPIPGVATPTEIDRGIAAGCRWLKFFPAEPLGGVALLKSLAAPFAHTGVKFIPTGGIDAANARSYLALPAVAAVGGSWMVAPKLIQTRNWSEIARLTREAVELAGGGA